MNRIFFEGLLDKRINKIYDVLGKDWFAGKTVLELGACHGDIGMAMQKYGADVLFTDIRPDNLAKITKNYPYQHFTPNTAVINQNEPYNLGKKFDLVIHMGTLYHIENWKQDLKCALAHTSLMFLETAVHPIEGSPDGWFESAGDDYNSFNALQPLFTQESVERTLTELGCKFFRFDNKSMNTEWSWMYDNCLIRHVYDWTYDNVGSHGVSTGIELEREPVVRYRRMWMVIK